MSSSVVAEPTTCAFCEYFDGGGEAKVGAARIGLSILGDCHNPKSPFFTVDSDSTCREFFRGGRQSSAP